MTYNKKLCEKKWASRWFLIMVIINVFKYVIITPIQRSLMRKGFILWTLAPKN